MLPEIPPPDDPHLRHMRWLFLAVITGSFLFLIPWIAYLSVSLPSHHEVSQWRLAWVGFDGALIAAIGVTAMCAWRRRQIFIPWAIITATLLCCDAWFDIVLDWNSDELLGSVITAVVAELPLAALLLYVARKMLRLTVSIAWQQAGRSGPVPPLSRLPLLMLRDAGTWQSRPQEEPRGDGQEQGWEREQQEQGQEWQHGHPRREAPLSGLPHPDGLGGSHRFEPGEQAAGGEPCPGGADAQADPAYDDAHGNGPYRGDDAYGPYRGDDAYTHTHGKDPLGDDTRRADMRRGDTGRRQTDREQPDDDRRNPPRRSA